MIPAVSARADLRGIVLPRGAGEVGLGYQYAHGDMSFNLDGSRIRGELLVPIEEYTDHTIALSGAYGLADGWELGFEIPWLARRFRFDSDPHYDTSGNLITHYPSERPQGLGDARFYSTFAPWESYGLRVDLKTASGADNFHPTRMPESRPEQYLGSGQTDVALTALGDYRSARNRFRWEAGYRLRLPGVSNVYLDRFNPPDELVLKLQWMTAPLAGLAVGTVVDYMHQAAPNSVSVLALQIPVWVDLGSTWQFRATAGYPVYGKDYPALFPAQLADPYPLLGPTAGASLHYRFRD